jgi:hypothetical protein
MVDNMKVQLLWWGQPVGERRGAMGTRFPGTGERIRARLVALGYQRPNGSLDLPRFLAEHDYDPRYLYGWAKGTFTPLGNYLERLAKDLETTRSWLLLGEGPVSPSRRITSDKARRRPIRIQGGSDAPGSHIMSSSRWLLDLAA